MSEARLGRALRAGNVSKLKAIEAANVRAPRQYASAFDPRRFDQVAAAFLDEMSKTAWPGFTMDDIRSPSRLRRYAWPRHVLTRLLRDCLDDGASYPNVATYTGREDHTSAIYAAQQAEEVFRRSPLFGDVANKVRARFKDES
jgi:hypothetical protein